MTQDGVKGRSEDKPWSGSDLFELQSSVARGDLVEESAALLRRRADEVVNKIRELQSEASIELAYCDAMASRARQTQLAPISALTAVIVLATAFLLGVTLALVV